MDNKINITKESKMEFLAETLRRCELNEPCLNLKEIAEVIAFEVSDLTEFLKAYKKKIKEENQ